MMSVECEFRRSDGERPPDSALRIPHSCFFTPNSALRTQHSSGFTLLEILLVVLVIGIASAAFLPTALDSVEGIRLRSAVREVISLNKYARARAVLDHKPVALLYDKGRGRVELAQLPAQDTDVGSFLDTPTSRLGDEDLNFDASAGGVKSLARKKLSDYVVVDSVEGLEEVDDTWYAIYYPSGMCDAHTITLRDNRGDKASIRVSGMTGDIKLDMDK
jgi:prepilin-type N-terminal cleavage/methylation domain-containing protein